MKKFNQFTSEAKGYRDVNRQVASAQDKADRAQAKNVTSKGKKLGMLADPYSGKPTKQEVWEYKGKKWLVLGKSVEVFVPMKYHKIVKESLDAYIDDFNYALKGQAKMLRQKGRITLPDGGRLKKGHKVSWLAADKKKVHGVIDFHEGGRYIDSIKVTKSQSRFYKVGDYAVDVNAADIGLTFTEDIEQIDEVTKAEAKQLATKLKSLKRSGFRVTIGDQPRFFWATASKINADKSHKAAVDVIIKAFKAKLDYSMPGDERGDFVKRYKSASGIEIEFERSTEIDDGSKTLQVNVSTEPYSDIKEDIANVAGGPLGSNPSTGSIAGYDPMLKKKPLKRSKFAGTECFEVDSDTFQKCHTGHGKYERWDKYLKDDCDTCKNIRAYAKRYPQKDIVIQREGCGTMTYLKRKGVHY